MEVEARVEVLSGCGAVKWKPGVEEDKTEGLTIRLKLDCGRGRGRACQRPSSGQGR